MISTLPLVASLVSLGMAGPPAVTFAYGPGFGGGIPDNDAIGFLSPIMVEPSFPIESIEVRLKGLDHGYCSDLTIELRHPGVSQPMLLVQNIRFGNSADFDGDYVFTDSGANLWATANGLGGLNDLPPGAYQPSDVNGNPTSLNARFVGEDAQGPWVLRIYDDDFLVAGSFLEWELVLEGGPECPEPIEGDLNADGAVNVFDLLELLSRWGNVCGG